LLVNLARPSFNFVRESEQYFGCGLKRRLPGNAPTVRDFRLQPDQSVQGLWHALFRWPQLALQRLDLRDRSGSPPSQSMHWNLRPPVLASMKRMGLRHFGQGGGGGFLGMALNS
jgi:hypothetical protein